MSVKIRLQRFGRKKSAYYHIVVADARSPRDGKCIERIGDYNPTSNPATITLNREKAVQWLAKGAQPTDTCRAILSYNGVMYHHHLNKGVAKGALTTEQAEAKLAKWMEEKQSKIAAKSGSVQSGKESALKSRMEHEAKVNEDRAKKIAAKNSEIVIEGAAAEEAPEATAEEAAPAEEAPAAE